MPWIFSWDKFCNFVVRSVVTWNENSSIGHGPHIPALIYAYVHVCTCTCMYMYVHVCTCMYMYMYVHVCTCTCIHVCTCMYMYVHVCTCMYMYVHVHTCMYMYVHVCTCMYMYVHVCTCTLHSETWSHGLDQPQRRATRAMRVGTAGGTPGTGPAGHITLS